MRGIEICVVGESPELIVEIIESSSIRCVAPCIINTWFIDRVAESVELYHSIMKDTCKGNAFLNRYDIQHPSDPFSPKALFSKKGRRCKKR